MKAVMRTGLIGAAILMATIFMSPAVASTSLAADPKSISKSVCEVPGNERLAGCESGDQKLDRAAGSSTAGGGYLESLVNVFTFIAGLIAMVFILVGGIRYITSTGDAGRIKQAKDTLMYAVVGLIVVGLARVIIGFIIGAST